jgi:signal transduction histidine kinase/ligand-binding sensor domain-containing protein
LKLEILNPKFEMHSKVFYLFLIAFLCGSIFLPSLKAQETPLFAQNLHQWGAVSLFNGLPSDSVRAIAQDKDGIMWFGTDNGLAKYDGRRVQAVSLAGVKSEKVRTLKVTNDGTLWIGTDSGATRFIDGTFYPIKETEDFVVVAITENAKGTIILATQSGRIFECRKNADRSLSVDINFPQSLEKIVNTLQVTSIAADDGKYILSTLGRSLINVEDGEANEIYSRPRPYYVNTLIRDKTGDIWFGTDAKRNASGLYLAKELSRPENIGVEIGAVSAFAVNEENDLWVGTTERGAYVFKAKDEIAHYTFENSAGGLRSNRIYTVFVDREDVVWFGTDRGISRFDSSSPFNKVLSESSNSNFIRTLFQSTDGKIFAGTNRGLFTHENENWQEVSGFANNVIYAIAENTLGQILIGTSEGLFTLNKENLLDEDIRAIQTFRGKTYAAVFGRGIKEVKDDEDSLIFSNKSVMTLYSDNEKLWIGTAEDGVFSFDGKQVSAESSLAELKGITVRQIAGKLNEGLWFATEKGLFVLKDGKLDLAVSDLIARDVVISKNGDIWCATIGFGLLHIKFDEEFGWLISKLGEEQGMPSQQTFTLLPVEKQILVGSNRGIANYTPSQNPPLLIPTRIVSQRLHQPDELIDGINLDYPQNSLTIEVTALSNRTFPEQFQYAFLLKDGKGEVISKKLSRDSRFLMENLDPDKYSVEIRAFDKDLLVSETLRFQFSIASAPFPWISTALVVLLAIASIALVWAFIERGRIKSANRQLATARFDLANEAERERRRIARDLHDQTLADLRNLMLMSDKLPESENGEMKTDFRSEVESVSDEIRRICEDLSPSVLENVGFSASLEFLLSHTFTQSDKEFKYKFTCQEDLEEHLDLLPNEQMQIYRIAQEVLNNIAKHSEADFVEMKIYNSDEDGFTLKIENNGLEFDAENSKRGRGISNIKARANLVKAEVLWQPRDLGGMSFLLHKEQEKNEK